MHMNKPIGSNKTVLLNFSSIALIQGIAFFSAPIFTRLLGTSQYGMFSIYNAWVSVFSAIMGLGVGVALSTGRYHFKDDYYKFRSSVLLTGTSAGIIVVLLGVLAINPLSKLFGFGYWITLLVLITALSRFITSFSNTAWVFEKKPQVNFWVSLSISLLTIGLSLLFILTNDRQYGYIGRIVGVSLPYIIMACVLWVVIYKIAPARIEKIYAKYALGMGIPIVFHALSQTVLVQSDRVMMQHMNVEMSNIGIYSAFYALSSVLGTFLSSLNISWTPFYYDDLDAHAWKKLDKKCLNYIELFTVLSCSFILLSREVGLLYAGRSYISGISIIPILVFGVYFTFMYQFAVNFEQFHRRTSLIAIGTISAAITNILLNLLLIPIMGIYGAALATSLSYFVLFIIHLFFVKHLKGIAYHLHIRVFIPALASVLLCSCIFYFLGEVWSVRWGIGIVLLSLEAYRIYQRKSIF